MKKTQLGLLAVLLGIGFSTSVLAHDSIGFSLNIGQPYYYEPAPVYYAAPPVVYYQPRPVYREYYSVMPGAYYYPRVNRYYDNDGWRDRHEHRWHRHHGHDD
jgi:hypothetical protein